MTSDLAGRRILVAEDEALIAMVIQQVLLDLGCVVVGPVGKLAQALQLAETERLDAAILDVTIRGGDVFPVARILAARAIAFILASGYASSRLPEDLRDRPRLIKPFSNEDLARAIRAIFEP